MMAVFLALFAGWLIYVLGRVMISPKNKNIETVHVYFKDNAETAEGVVRTVMLKRGVLGGDSCINLVDAGSSDETPLILSKLAAKHNLTCSSKHRG